MPGATDSLAHGELAERPLSELLEQAHYAYMPNKALLWRHDDGH